TAPRRFRASESHRPHRLRPDCRPVRLIEGLKSLAIPRFGWDNPPMTVVADAKKRVVLPPVKPGDRFDVQLSVDGKLVLTPLVPIERPNRVKLVRKHGYLVAVTSRPITQAQTRAYLDEFP